MAIRLIWTSKNRSGVVANFLMSEWANRRVEGHTTVVIVANHKTGDKEPATMVIDGEMVEHMAR